MLLADRTCLDQPNAAAYFRGLAKLLLLSGQLMLPPQRRLARLAL